ncbi:MAG: PaaI family thioesterase [Clostridiales bacterium]|nr:PaaI family thioesterase [Clostridiales bacterium]
MNIDESLKKKELTGFVKFLGIKITRAEPGYSECEAKIDQNVLNPSGTAHGGFTMTLMDTAAGVCGVTRGRYITTANANVAFLNPVRSEATKITAMAKEIKTGWRLQIIDVDVYDDTGVHVAKGTFTFYRLAEIEGFEIGNLTS